MFEVIDNFLEEKEFKKIKGAISNEYFPWFYQDTITFSTDPSDHYYFAHYFYAEHARTSEWFYLFNNFLNKIKCNGRIRIKGNLFLGQKEPRKNPSHQDYKFKHKGCLFYINNNNGATYFKQEKVMPKENRAVFFDPSEKHSSSLCTNRKRRITINFNYI